MIEQELCLYHDYRGWCAYEAEPETGYCVKHSAWREDDYEVEVDDDE